MKIKVLHILNRFIIGGPSIIALNIINSLPSNYEVKLIVGGKDNKEEWSEYMLDDTSEKSLIYIPQMRRSLNPFQDISTYYAIKKVIKEFKPDIVHTHASKAGAIGRLAAANCKVPVVLHTFHGHVFHSYFNGLITRLFIKTERYLAKKSTNIIALSESQKQELSQKYKICNHDKIVVVPNGIALQKFIDNQAYKRNLWRKKLSLSEDTVLVGIVGRMAPVKNHKMFVEVLAASLERQKNTNIKFVIVGDGKTRISVQEDLTKLNIPYNYLPENADSAHSKVILTSWETEMDQVYAGLDIVCLTSLNEGSPISLLEAQAAKRPIVSTNVGGVSDTIIENESAFLTPPNDVESFTNKLEQLINNVDLRQKMGENGFKFVNEKYGQERLVQNMDNLYKNLITKI